MIFLKGFVTLIVLFIIPELIGLLITNFLNKEKGNLILSFILGYLAEFAICQIITVPLIYAKVNFTVLRCVFWSIIAILVITSMIINRKRFKNIFIDSIKELKKTPKLLLVITIVLIAVQVYGLVGYMHSDDDDAFYVATATTTVQTNTIFKYSAQSGREYGGDYQVPLKYVLGPFPMYLSLLSSAISIQPAIFAHSIIPVIFIPMAYMVYYLLGEFLFKDKSKSLLFVILLCILTIWGNYSSRTNFTFLLFRIWQGKAILANIIIPMVWLLFLMAEKEEFKFWNCFCILITIFAGILTTTMGIVFPAMIIVILSMLYLIRTKNLKNTIKICSTCIPCTIYMLLYIIL